MEVDFFSWLCFVVFLFEGAGGGGFFLVGCVLLFLFLKALVELEVDFSLIGYALLLLLVSFLLLFFVITQMKVVEEVWL